MIQIFPQANSFSDRFGLLRAFLVLQIFNVFGPYNIVSLAYKYSALNVLGNDKCRKAIRNHEANIVLLICSKQFVLQFHRFLTTKILAVYLKAKRYQINNEQIPIYVNKSHARIPKTTFVIFLKVYITYMHTL